MRLASYNVNGRDSYGVISNNNSIIDLGSRLEQKSILQLLQSDAVDSARKFTNEKPDYALSDISLSLPVPGGEKIICVGINYPEREEEYKGEIKRGSYPNLFVRFPSSFSPHEQPIIRPKVSDQLDYEGEVALVIGKPGRHIPNASAYEHIAAITAANEGTVRDWVKHGSKNVTQGKNFERSGSIGPWIVTTDELDPSGELTLTTRVNGKVRQNNSTKNMFWHFDELINYISTFITLLPGDIILTGTPTGAGSHLDPPVYLVPGDVVEVEVQGVGMLRNRVLDEE
ncbi:MAG: fumarylacetoacetate hydrolase family protein [Acidimicrobiaceae bacterium]|nr:fumarylacetoacetate hydrolase family protein [Acidimicrobiaceae bacterium]